MEKKRERRFEEETWKKGRRKVKRDKKWSYRRWDLKKWNESTRMKIETSKKLIKKKHEKGRKAKSDKNEAIEDEI